MTITKVKKKQEEQNDRSVFISQVRSIQYIILIFTFFMENKATYPGQN